jgi:ABC-type multidrug transport system permease subunit
VRRILYLAHAELLHVVRDRATLAQTLVVPIVQLLILANAATFQIRHTPTAVVDLDRTSTSRGLVNRLGATDHFRIDDVSSSFERANDRLLSGAATLVVAIPHDFEASLVRTGAAPVELSVDAVRGSSAGIVQAYAAQVITDYAADLTPLDRVSGPPHIDVRLRSWYNQTQDYRIYMIPGLLVALVTIIGTLLTAQNIAREKELGTLEQLNVTPITRAQFIAAKMLPFWALALVDLTIGLAIGRFVFGVPLLGSLPLLFGVAAVYLVTALGIGLLISTVVETQQQAMFVTFFIISGYLLLSGLFTPIDSMAPWVQAASQLNPVRHFVTISRAILMKGAGLREIAQPLAILCASAVIALSVAVRQYDKRAS